MALKFVENIAAPEPGFGKIRFQCERPFICGERVVVALHGVQHVAATNPRFGKVWF